MCVCVSIYSKNDLYCLSCQIVALSTCLLVALADAKPYNQGYGRSRTAARAPIAASASTYSDDSYGSARSARQAEAEPKPEPYSFTYETTDEYGTTLTRTESGDEQGNVKGSYMYRDPEGVYRTVEYADNGDGFNANVQTNEPGVVSHKAADAEYIKN